MSNNEEKKEIDFEKMFISNIRISMKIIEYAKQKEEERKEEFEKDEEDLER